MAHVTVPEVTPFIEYSVGAGGQTVFTIPSSWAFFDVETDIRVFKDGVELTYGATPADATEFSVAGTSGTDSGFNGGTVTLGASVASCTIAIQRDVPVKRTEDFPYPSSTFNIQALNTALDKIAAWAQQFKAIFNRSIRLADGDSDATLTLPVATERADKVLGFDGSGNVSALIPNTDAYISASAFGLTLIDDTDAATARTTLELGTAAVLDTGTDEGDVVVLGSGGALPAVDGSALTGIDTGDVQQALDAANQALMEIDALSGQLGPRSLGNAVSDAFNDESGIDTTASLNETYDATGDYYHNPGVEEYTVDYTPSDDSQDSTPGDGASLAQSFQVSSTAQITKIRFKTGSSAGTVNVRIETDSSGPSGTLAHANAKKDGVVLSTSTVTEVTLDGAWTPAAATTYWLRITPTSGTTAIRLLNTGTYADGNAWREGTGNRSSDWYFGIFQVADPPDMTLQSKAATVIAAAAPTEIRMQADIEAVDALTLTGGTPDIVLSGSRDGNTTFSTITLDDTTAFLAGQRKIIRGTVDVSGQPSDTDVVVKAVTDNAKELRIHGWTIQTDQTLTVA